MSDERIAGPCCAHMRIVRRQRREGSTVYGEWWECSDCATEFIPETVVKHRLAATQEERDEARAQRNQLALVIDSDGTLAGDYEAMADIARDAMHVLKQINGLMARMEELEKARPCRMCSDNGFITQIIQDDVVNTPCPVCGGKQ